MASEKFGISGGGKTAEEMFMKATGATPSPKAAFGDAFLFGRPVEVKRASSSTLNQVRAVKYIPLVVFHEPNEQWYVVPAHVVVALVSRKSRGQHTENPFESATLSVQTLGAYRVASAAHLYEATLHAIEQSDRHPEVREEMNRVLDEAKLLARRSLERVRDLVKDVLPAS